MVNFTFRPMNPKGIMLDTGQFFSVGNCHK